MADNKGSKKLGKKQIIIIAVAATLLVAAIVVAVTVPLVLKNQEQPLTISFDSFDSLSDCSVTVSWNKLRGIKKYTVEFCYGQIEEEQTKRITTENTSAIIERQTGVLNVRLKADDRDFTDWTQIAVPALKLRAPSAVAFSTDTFSASWSAVNFDYYGVRTAVSVYSYDIGFDGKYTSLGFMEYSTETDSFAALIKAYIDSWYEPGVTEWTDVTVLFRVKALTRAKFLGSETVQEGYLSNAYEDGDYAETSVVITKQIYERMLQNN